MQIEMLEEFIVFARHLNFSNAAKELHITQSTLSKHIADMERELGFTVAQRGQTISLTQEGQLMLECAHRTIQEYRDGIEKCKQATKPIRLKWFANSKNSDYDSFMETCHHFPIVFASPSENGEEPYFSELQRDLVDIVAVADLSFDEVFVNRAHDHGVSVVPIGRFPAALAFSKNHPLAQKEHLTQDDIRRCEILIPSGSYFDLYSKASAHALGDDLDLKFIIKPAYSEMGNISYMDFGSAIFFYPESTIRSLLQSRKDVVIRTELNGQQLFIDHGVLCRENESNPLVAEFIEAFRTYCTQAEEAIPNFIQAP